MKTYMPLDGLRWSRDSGSAHCDMPQSAVLGRSGGGYQFHLKRKLNNITISGFYVSVQSGT